MTDKAPTTLESASPVSPTAGDRRDRLSALPVELLREIWTSAYPPDPSETSLPPLPPSRLFLPLWREIRFRRVEITSYGQLDRLCKLVAGKAQIGKRIKQLDVEFERANKDSADPPVEMTDPQTPSKKALIKLFKALKNLRFTYLSGSTRLACLAISAEVAANCFPKLERLFLVSTFHSLKDPFHPSHYTNLPFFPKLAGLGIIVERPHQTIKTSAKSFPSSPVAFPPIFQVHLNGPLGGSESAKCLLSSFSFVGNLSLVDLNSPFPLAPLLGAIEAPEAVGSLGLESINSPYDASIEQALLRFTELDQLTVGGTVPSSSSSFYDTLRKLPPSHLEFGEEASAATEQLKTLVAGPQKHPSLHHLILNNVAAERGSRIIEDKDGTAFLDAAQDRLVPWPDWQLADWTSDFSRSGLEDLLRTAKDSGVLVTGEALTAPEIEDEFDRELDIAAELDEELGF
ncbi:hypothetical protein JCM10213_002838 [Rhodosporidiobolus nylandii]